MTYNTKIPDIAHVDWFVEDLEQYRSAHDGKLQKFVNVAICNNLRDSPSPKSGYAYVAARRK